MDDPADARPYRQRPARLRLGDSLVAGAGVRARRRRPAGETPRRLLGRPSRRARRRDRGDARRYPRTARRDPRSYGRASGWHPGRAPGVRCPLAGLRRPDFVPARSLVKPLPGAHHPGREDARRARARADRAGAPSPPHPRRLWPGRGSRPRPARGGGSGRDRPCGRYGSPRRHHRRPPGRRGLIRRRPREERKPGLASPSGRNARHLGMDVTAEAMGAGRNGRHLVGA
jgi:hypothetical protein